MIVHVFGITVKLIVFRFSGVYGSGTLLLSLIRADDFRRLGVSTGLWYRLKFQMPYRSSKYDV